MTGPCREDMAFCGCWENCELGCFSHSGEASGLGESHLTRVTGADGDPQVDSVSFNSLLAMPCANLSITIVGQDKDYFLNKRRQRLRKSHILHGVTGMNLCLCPLRVHFLLLGSFSGNVTSTPKMPSALSGTQDAPATPGTPGRIREASRKFLSLSGEMWFHDWAETAGEGVVQTPELQGTAVEESA